MASRGDIAARLIPALLYALPVAAALLLAVGDALDAAAWSRLLDDTQFPRALAASAFVGAASTLLALALAMAATAALHGSRAWPRIERALGALLAVPHVAFAIGFALLVMPSGPLARLAAPLAGWGAPPDLATPHDRFGLTLVAALVLKELPFLLWATVAELHRAGHDDELRRSVAAAASMGYPPRSAWWRVLWPQILPRLALPLAAVWAYGTTVVDMAIVLGPASPPTLAVLAWQWLLDADPARNAQGAAAALLLAAVVLAGAALAALAWRALLPAWRARASRGDRPALRRGRGRAVAAASLGIAALYAAVLALLAVVSFAGVWTFPALVPQVLNGAAWQAVAASAPALATTAVLAFVSAASGVAIAVAWLEATPAAADARAAPLVFATMLVPGVLLAAGLYRLALVAGVDGRFAGLWLAHTLYTAPYATVALAPAYRAFDARYALTAAALGHRRVSMLLRIKWPLLGAPLAAAFAVAFAVSVAQYLPTQFVGAGRIATVTTEAVTLASGGQRTTMAAFALVQAVLPALVFGAALAFARRSARRRSGAGR